MSFIKKISWAVLFIFLMSGSVFAQEKDVFTIENGDFIYKDKPIHIYAGEMHYSRIPREYWRHRMKMIKAMGLNTIATYVFWNYHNTSPGVWDFKTGNRDLTAYIKMAQEEGLFPMPPLSNYYFSKQKP